MTGEIERMLCSDWLPALFPHLMYLCFRMYVRGLSAVDYLTSKSERHGHAFEKLDWVSHRFSHREKRKLNTNAN